MSIGDGSLHSSFSNILNFRKLHQWWDSDRVDLDSKGPILGKTPESAMPIRTVNKGEGGGGEA